MNTQHEWVWVMALIPPYGQAPFWGGGGSPALWVLVSNPSSLLSNCELSTTRVPPELVPEYPRALFSIHALCTQPSHTCWQAPMYLPESEKLLA